MVDRRSIGGMAVLAVTVLAAGCAQLPVPASDVADTPASDPVGPTSATQSSSAFGEPLLGGVPDGCRLVEAVGAPDDPTSEDAALGDVVLAALHSEVARGPLVAVDVDQREQVSVVAARVFAAGEVMVWVVDGTKEPMATAANMPAASVSDVPLDEVDTAGTDPVASAVASATDCAWVAGEPFRPPEPQPTPSMRSDLLSLEPQTAQPGQTVEMRFPQQTMRGIAFHLDERVGGEWVTRYLMTSDGNGDEPFTVSVDQAEGYGVPDVGVGGSGPDRVVLPPDVPPGAYRICTANAGEDFCAPIDIRAR